MRRFFCSLVLAAAVVAAPAVVLPDAAPQAQAAPASAFYRYVTQYPFVYVYQWQWPGIWVLWDIRMDPSLGF